MPLPADITFIGVLRAENRMALGKCEAFAELSAGIRP
jgi:hypothetical protein